MRVFLVATCSFTLSLGSALGLNLQKLSMTREETKHANANTTTTAKRKRRRPPYLQPLWCIGFTIQVLDAIGDFIFIGLAPQSLLAPLGALSLGFNVILAPIFHPNEIATRRVVGATILIYIGTLTTILHAPNVSPTYTLEKIINFITKAPLFWWYATACLTFQCCLVLDGRKRRTAKGDFGIIHYCGLAGCFGGECILFAKSTSELIKNAITTHDLDDWTGTSVIPYFLVVGMIICVLSNVNFLNQGLAKFDALLVIPIYQSFWNLFGITGGLIFFQEYQYMSTRDGVLYATGIVITLIGVMLLVQERKSQGGSKGHHNRIHNNNHHQDQQQQEEGKHNEDDEAIDGETSSHTTTTTMRHRRVLPHMVGDNNNDDNEFKSHV